MHKQVQWGILGAGKIAHSFANDFSVITGASLVAIASSNEDRAAEFANTHSLQLVLNYQQLYESQQVDAVYVATTHNFHFEQCRQCLLHGKHVLCEKPVTLNHREFEILANLAQKNNLFLMEGMWTWFLPPVIKAAEWLKEGKIGTLKVIDATFGVPMEKKWDGRLYNINLAGGALLDLGVYPVAFATLFTKLMPQSITASGVLAQTGVDERTGMILQYGDITASLFTSMVNIMNNKAILYGDKGYIEIPDFYKATSAFLYDDFHNLIETFEDKRTTKGYHFEVQHATDCIAAGKIQSNVVSHHHTLIVQKIMTEVRRQIGLTYPGELAGPN